MVNAYSPNPIMAALPMAPSARWVAIDIETAGGRIEEAEAELRRTWRPDKRWKPETIGQRWLQAREKLEARLALLDSARIVCVSILVEGEPRPRCLHCLPADVQVSEGLVERFDTEAAMLEALRGLLERVLAEGGGFVGHNVRSFDLRRLRHAYIRAGLRLPAPLAAETQIFDTMSAYWRRFAGSDADVMVSLQEVLEAFGIEHHKGLVDGAMIGDLLEAGQFELIVKYALLDVIAEADLFLRMSGQRGK